MKPMPMPMRSRPRLPKGGIQLAASSAISTQLADIDCPDKCCSEKAHSHAAAPTQSTATHTHHQHTLASSRNHNDHLCPLPIVDQLSHQGFPLPMDHFQPGDPSLSNLDLFKLDDIGDEMLLQSSEPMVFDDILLTLVDENVQVAPVVQPAKPEVVDAHVLHRTVILFPNDANLVQTALVGGPPEAVRTPSPLPHQGYSYPLHLAICQGANLPVLQLLVQAGLQVLAQKDGPQGFTPLMLALTHLPHRPDVHQLLRKALPQAAGIACDAQHEVPLHVACRNSTQRNCVELIRGLLQDYPPGAVHTNTSGLTPLQIVALQPATAPHRAIVYQSLQQVALPQQSSSSSSTSWGSSAAAARTSGGGGAILTVSPC